MRLAFGSVVAALIAHSALVGAATPPAGEEFVTVEEGNIFLARPGGRNLQLTSSGRDSDPILSPDRKRVAFVRATPDRKIAAGSGDDTSELWLMEADGSSPVRLLEAHVARRANKLEGLVALISNPHFSCDGKRIFFQTTAWVTSGAIHVIDLATKKEHFVLAGDGLSIVREGDYRDCVVAQQHRYFIGGGSFDWFWLFRPDGAEIGPIGEDTQNFEATNPTQ